MTNKLISPFTNDIFSLIWLAFNTLYPDKDCICYWTDELKDEEGNEVFGVTVFADDGNTYVYISGKLMIEDAAEVFAHELAHVATGICDAHGAEWEAAFSKIHETYMELQLGDTIK